jgi:hypothetical protein
LRYWLASALKISFPMQARTLYRECHLQFVRTGDVRGQTGAAAGAIATHVLDFTAFDEVDHRWGVRTEQQVPRAGDTGQAGQGRPACHDRVPEARTPAERRAAMSLSRSA